MNPSNYLLKDERDSPNRKSESLTSTNVGTGFSDRITQLHSEPMRTTSYSRFACRNVPKTAQNSLSGHQRSESEPERGNFACKVIVDIAFLGQAHRMTTHRKRRQIPLRL